ncbi:hypothetical protein [Marinomonas sp. TW1]|uniref:hypothetical protein n=1 Tax=Marinomonas sp. TW1 TaxID=1561203 RepID=UPI0007AF34BE|nr:hypothetical protein [Marinomonas sp. TW1]KZN13614.1 hypothetical protein OA79_09580 [Marinomonas sp. TW1]
MEAVAKWLWNVLVAIDQLGNAIAGGDPDITISARVGYFANRSPNKRFHYYWKFLERVIDFTFYPLDGPKHCLSSLAKDNEQGHVHGSDFVRAILALIAITACVFISLLTWTAYLLGQRPK